MISNNIQILVVVYNSLIMESKLLNIFGDKVYFIDNSTNSEIQKKNIDYANRNSINYKCLFQNMGLSKSYNIFIKTMLSTDYLMILDDDTQLPSNFMELIDLEYQQDVKLYLPQVKSIITGNLESPYYIDSKYIGTLFEKRNLTRFSKDYEGLRKNLKAINSGMIIHRDVFDNFEYNEKLFLGYVDTDFMERNCNIEYKVMDITLQQHYSREDSTKSQARHRYAITLNDTRIIMGKKFYGYLPLSIANRCYHNKDLAYVKIAFNYLFKKEKI